MTETDLDAGGKKEIDTIAANSLAMMYTENIRELLRFK